MNLKPGDKINFIDTGEGIVVAPVKDIFDLVDPNQKEKTIEMVEELIREHRQEAARRG